MGKVLAIVVAFVVLIGGAIWVMASTNKDKQSTGDQSTSTIAEPTTGSSDSEQAQAVGRVTIENNAFNPSSITVKKGTKVTWTNNDSVRHDVMPDAESDAFKASDLLGKGETYQFTFNTPGTYTYHCTPHPFMKGTVVVTE